MQAEKPPSAGASKWAAMLARGHKNLGAMQRAAAKPTTSPAGKKTLAETIAKQTAINKALEKLLNAENHRAS